MKRTFSRALGNFYPEATGLSLPYTEFIFLCRNSFSSFSPFFPRATDYSVKPILAGTDIPGALFFCSIKSFGIFAEQISGYAGSIAQW